MCCLALKLILIPKGEKLLRDDSLTSKRLSYILPPLSQPTNGLLPKQQQYFRNEAQVSSDLTNQLTLNTDFSFFVCVNYLIAAMSITIMQISKNVISYKHNIMLLVKTTSCSYAHMTNIYWLLKITPLHLWIYYYITQWFTEKNK